jgi:hypothetical protein
MAQIVHATHPRIWNLQKVGIASQVLVRNPPLRGSSCRFQSAIRKMAPEFGEVGKLTLPPVQILCQGKGAGTKLFPDFFKAPNFIEWRIFLIAIFASRDHL